MKQTTDKKLFFHFLAGMVTFLGGAALLVFLMDPFFHYHKPWFGLEPVQFSHQYQVPGAVKHLDYDALLLGSSVTMSINSDTLDEHYKTTTVKAVGNLAPAPFLAQMLEDAFDTHDLKYVFYGLDVFSFYENPKQQIFPEEINYLTNKNPFDDVAYLLNGTILGEVIPDMLKEYLSGNYCSGLAYQFNANLASGPEYVLKSYNPALDHIVYDERSYDFMYDEVEANLVRLENIVAAHPETQFEFFFPPYCITWWCRADKQNMYESYQYTLKRILERLFVYDNVAFYTTDFNNADVITDFYQYIDVVHGNTGVTERNALEIGNPDYQITPDNYEEALDKLDDILQVFEEKVDEEGIGFVYAGPLSID